MSSSAFVGNSLDTPSMQRLALDRYPRRDHFFTTGTTDDARSIAYPDMLQDSGYACAFIDTLDDLLTLVMGRCET